MFTGDAVPTYQYICTACAEKTEAVQAFTDDPLTECPACGQQLRKLFSSVGVVFKGSGFYRTDSRTDDKGTGKTDDAASGKDAAGKDTPGKDTSTTSSGTSSGSKESPAGSSPAAGGSSTGSASSTPASSSSGTSTSTGRTATSSV